MSHVVDSVVSLNSRFRVDLSDCVMYVAVMLIEIQISIQSEKRPVLPVLELGRRLPGCNGSSAYRSINGVDWWAQAPSIPSLVMAFFADCTKWRLFASFLSIFGFSCPFWRSPVMIIYIMSPAQSIRAAGVQSVGKTVRVMIDSTEIVGQCSRSCKL